MKLDNVLDLTDIEKLTDTQTACVEAAAAGRDVLAVIATGGGKSAIYQLAGPVVAGITVVVVPLLALAADQQRSLAETGLPPAAEINGSTNEADRRRILSQLRNNEVEYLFITPESLQNSDLKGELTTCNVSLLVVDEAHCVVTWGQSFRSDYLLLGEIRQELGSPTCIALTASADPRIRADLVRLLQLDNPLVAVLPLLRPNIGIGLHGLADRKRARAAFVDFLADSTGKTLAYVPTRKHCTEIADELRSAGRAAFAYHGQLSPADRSVAADNLEKRKDCVVVATNAFGMGIDIADISTVAHLDMPATLIDYYQEIGRAGRDGRPATAAAFVSLRKRSRRTFTAGVHRTSVEDCARVLAAIGGGATSRRAIAAELELSVGRIARSLTVLVMAGAVSPGRSLSVADASVGAEEIAEICSLREEFDRSQRNAVANYKTSQSCRWQQLLAALGEAAEPCNSCDNCKRNTGETPESDERNGARVRHESFGLGKIVSLTDSVAQVAFDEVGPKSIDLDLCLAEGHIRFVDS